MAKRKKKILFDVFGDPHREESSMVAADWSRGSGGRGGGPFHLSRNLLSAAAAVFVVFVGVSYYLGTIRGASRDSAADPRSQGAVDKSALRRDTPVKEPPVVEPKGRFSVLAWSYEYTKFTQKDAKKTLGEAVKFLRDQGFRDVEAFDQENMKKPGSGKFMLWVERAEAKESLDSIVRKIRGLTLRNQRMFKSAVALEVDAK
jgi:hypothetical protein